MTIGLTHKTHSRVCRVCFCHAGVVLQPASLPNASRWILWFLFCGRGVLHTGLNVSFLGYSIHCCIVTQCLFLACCQWSYDRIVQAFRYLTSVMQCFLHRNFVFHYSILTPPPTRGGDIVFELFVRAAVCLSVNKVLWDAISLSLVNVFQRNLLLFNVWVERTEEVFRAKYERSRSLEFHL